MTAAESQGSETCEVGGGKKSFNGYIQCKGQTWEKRQT